MNDQQLYLAIGVPLLINLLVVLWQARAVEKTLGARIDGLEKVMNARFEVVDARFEAVYARFETAQQQLLRVEEVLDSRLRHLEDERRPR